MINPDGVVCGNNKSSCLGVNLNTCFRGFKSKNNGNLNPELKSIQNIMEECKSQYRSKCILFIDIHGQSKNPFTYFQGPNLSKSDMNFTKCQIILQIITSKNFQYDVPQCRQKTNHKKMYSIRNYAQREIGIPLSFSLQMSNGIIKKQQETVKILQSNQFQIQIDQSDFIKLGEDLVDSISEFMKIEQQYNNRILESKFNSPRKQKYKNQLQIFQESYQWLQSQPFQDVTNQDPQGFDESESEKDEDEYLKPVSRRQLNTAVQKRVIVFRKIQREPRRFIQILIQHSLNQKSYNCLERLEIKNGKLFQQQELKELEKHKPQSLSARSLKKDYYARQEPADVLPRKQGKQYVLRTWDFYNPKKSSYSSSRDIDQFYWTNQSFFSARPDPIQIYQKNPFFQIQTSRDTFKFKDNCKRSFQILRIHNID